MRGGWKKSHYKRYAEFMREVRSGQRGKAKASSKRKKIELAQWQVNYKNYWKKYNRTAQQALGKTEEANADTGYAETPSASHPSNRTHRVEQVSREPKGKPSGRLR